MFHSRIAVFKEIILNDQTLFQWFKVDEEDQNHIVPSEILTSDQHWERLAID